MKLFLLLAAAFGTFLGSAVESASVPAFPVNSVIFRLHTKDDNDPGDLLVLNDRGESLNSSNFNPTNPTRFVIHGWQNSASSPVNVNIKKAYYDHPDSFNLIVVDWSVLAADLTYVVAALQVPGVGAVVAEMIKNLKDYESVSPATVTVIGHSLGAQVAGHAGKSLTGVYKLGAIVALDPANPLFGDIPLTIDQVGSGDANYVQAIQTNRGLLGQEFPVGDSSFYPNFGPIQPGCPLIDLTAIPLPGLCYHERAHELYAESVTTSTPFLGRKCSLGYAGIPLGSCVKALGSTNRKMGGEPLDTAASGVYYMATNGASPFSKGAAGV